jgi:hypothetical protein
MIEYVDRFSSRVLAAAVAGDPLPPIHGVDPQDDYVVHRFVSHAYERRENLFSFLEAVVKGRMLADALYFQVEGCEPSDDLERVEVYLDGRSSCIYSATPVRRSKRLSSSSLACSSIKRRSCAVLPTARRRLKRFSMPPPRELGPDRPQSASTATWFPTLFDPAKRAQTSS